MVDGYKSVLLQAVMALLNRYVVGWINHLDEVTQVFLLGVSTGVNVHVCVVNDATSLAGKRVFQI